MKGPKKTRIRLLSFVIIICGLTAIYRLFIVQVVKGDQYLSKSENQVEKPADTFFDRGTIYFTTKDGGNIAAATTRQGYTLSISPKDIASDMRETVYNRLSAIVPIDKADFDKRVSKENDPGEDIAFRLNRDQADAISSLKLRGVFLKRTSWRFYPGSNMSAHLVGFISPNKDGHKLEGRYGLEKQYEKVLSRKNDTVFVNFFIELFANVKKAVTGDELEGDIITTIEPVVQEQVEKVALAVNDQYSAKQTGIIVMDPFTGDIVSMAHVPTYDLNNFNEVDDYSVYRNPLVEDRFEFGSIMKPITMAAGLDVGAVSRNTTFYDKGTLTIDGRTIYNFDKRERGTVDMQDVLNNSLNTGMAFVVGKMGNKKFAEYMNGFFSKVTNIDLPNEQSPQTNLTSNRDIEYVTAAYGQGIAVNAVSMVRALASLGNGGNLVWPRVVSEIKYTNGTSEKIERPEKVRIFSEKTSEEITRMLIEVVDKALIGGTKSKNGYSVAAKTGTAQLVNPNTKSYYEDRYLHSFFGYFPAYKPRFIVFLYTLEPVGETYASHTLTDSFFEIADFLINYYQIPPDRDMKNS